MTQYYGKMTTQKDILNHIIEIKEQLGALGGDTKQINEHLKTLNGSVARHETNIKNNCNDISSVKLQLAKWGGAFVVISVLLQIILKVFI